MWLRVDSFRSLSTSARNLPSFSAFLSKHDQSQVSKDSLPCRDSSVYEHMCLVMQRWPAVYRLTTEAVRLSNFHQLQFMMQEADLVVPTLDSKLRTCAASGVSLPDSALTRLSFAA